MIMTGRAPYGARGLKYCGQYKRYGDFLSRPVWGAWIEIGWYKLGSKTVTVAPRMGRVD